MIEYNDHIRAGPAEHGGDAGARRQQHQRHAARPQRPRQRAHALRRREVRAWTAQGGLQYSIQYNNNHLFARNINTRDDRK